MSDKPLVYEEGGFIVYRASGFMGCPKALVAARQGYEGLPPPKRMQEMFDAGHEAEEKGLTHARELGYTVHSTQNPEVLYVTDRIIVTGHVDARGRLRGAIGDEVIEVKSQSQAQWDEFEKGGWSSGLFPKYKWQVSAYMLAVGAPLVLVRVNRDTGETQAGWVDKPFYSLDDIREKILGIEVMARTGDLPTTCSNRMYPCPFYYLHDDEKVERSEEEGLEVLVEQYQKNLAEEKKARGRKETARAALRASLGLGKVDIGGWRINFYEQKNRPSLDLERVAEAGIDLGPYMRQTVGERLRVSRREDDR